MANRPQINYYSRDFQSIKAQLVEYAKRFYPNVYSDFTEATFGSFILDATAYIGDVLSFQLDYQFNENLLETAINRENVFNVARQMGYREPATPSVAGFVTVFIKVPGTAGNVGPATDYLPILKRGTTFSTGEGAVYTLTEDIDFADNLTEFVVAEVNESTGVPVYYAAKQKAKVISGVLRTTQVDVLSRGNNIDFLEVEIDDSNIVEIVSVTDLEGNVYYQVGSLTQNLVYKAVLNQGQTSSNTVKVLTPFVAARRFKIDFRDAKAVLVFGNGKEDKNSTLNSINDPATVVLQKYAKDYISSTTLDPTIINDNDKFGISPSNTILTITYRSNTTNLISAGRNTLVNVSNPVFTFGVSATNEAYKLDVIGSLEVENEEPIIASTLNYTNDEIKQLASGIYSAQNRAVTTQDYETFSRKMPPEFGVVKRVAALRDLFSPRRAINLYVLGENNLGSLATVSTAVKDNLKTWLNQYKSISDSIDILDGNIINFQVKFSAIANAAFDPIDANLAANLSLRDYFGRRKYNFGESINISEILKRMNDLEEIDDVVEISFLQIIGPDYSGNEYNFIANTTNDGRYIKIPEKYLFEIINYDETIVGEVV